MPNWQVFILTVILCLRYRACSLPDPTWNFRSQGRFLVRTLAAVSKIYTSHARSKTRL